MLNICERDKWVQEQFDGADLGDKRLNKRLIAISKTMSCYPEGSIPKQFQTWSEVKGCYRFLSQPDITHRKIQLPHRESLKKTVSENQGVTLFIQDGSELDYTSKAATKGLGPIGNHKGYGLMIHSCLAIKGAGSGLSSI